MTIRQEIKIQASSSEDIIYLVIHDQDSPLNPAEYALLADDMPTKSFDHLPNLVDVSLRLSICQKIIDLHGGRMWVKISQSSSLILFTLPTNVLSLA